MQDLDDDGVKFGNVTDLNDNDLINTADEEEDVNVRCGGHKEEDSCDLRHGMFYALRDIGKGEELFTNYYGDFVSPSHSWGKMGL